MSGRPAIGQHRIETRIARHGGSLIIMQAQENLAQIGPRLDPMSLGTGENGEQDGCPWSCLLAAEEQPILAANGLVP